MVWIVEIDSEKTGSVWVDGERFVILFPHSDGRRWILRVGVKSDVSQNQERVYKNRSKALVHAKSLMRVRSW